MPVSFEVSKVEPGTLRLDTIPSREAIHRLAGFAGVRQDPTTLEVSPQLGWAVREAPES